MSPPRSPEDDGPLSLRGDRRLSLPDGAHARLGRGDAQDDHAPRTRARAETSPRRLTPPGPESAPMPRAAAQRTVYYEGENGQIALRKSARSEAAGGKRQSCFWARPSTPQPPAPFTPIPARRSTGSRCTSTRPDCDREVKSLPGCSYGFVWSIADSGGCNLIHRHWLVRFDRREDLMLAKRREKRALLAEG